MNDAAAHPASPALQPAPSGKIGLSVDTEQGTTLPPILKQYFHAALRWRWLIIGIIAAALVVGLVATLLMWSSSGWLPVFLPT